MYAAGSKRLPRASDSQQKEKGKKKKDIPQARRAVPILPGTTWVWCDDGAVMNGERSKEGEFIFRLRVVAWACVVCGVLVW